MVRRVLPFIDVAFNLLAGSIGVLHLDLADFAFHFDNGRCDRWKRGDEVIRQHRQPGGVFRRRDPLFHGVFGRVLALVNAVLNFFRRTVGKSDLDLGAEELHALNVHVVILPF